jgi:membrane protein
MDAPPLPWNRRIRDGFRLAWLVLTDALAAFFADGGLRGASSLAFYATLVLLPVLMLLTFLLSLAVGSNQEAMAVAAKLVAQVIPRFGGVILREVGLMARVYRSAGAFNALVLLWSLMPLVGAFRSILAQMFRLPRRPSIWAQKGLDLLTALVFALGLASMAALGLGLDLLKGFHLVEAGGLGLLLPFGFTVLLLLGNYAMFMPRVRFPHLLAGAVATAVLWFLLKPAFTLFLTWRHSYGLTFGSFKALFIVFIWIYYSMAVLLFGAEVTATLHRGEALHIKRLMEGRKGLPAMARRRFLRTFPAGQVLFQEGDGGGEMYHILEGAVGVRRNGQDLATLGPGAFVGEMSFLLGHPRSATARALEDTVCVAIHDRNVRALMREFPGTIQEMLVQMATRLRDTSERIGS